MTYYDKALGDYGRWLGNPELYHLDDDVTMEQVVEIIKEVRRGRAVDQVDRPGKDEQFEEWARTNASRTESHGHSQLYYAYTKILVAFYRQRDELSVLNRVIKRRKGALREFQQRVANTKALHYCNEGLQCNECGFDWPCNTYKLLQPSVMIREKDETNSQ